MSCVGLAGAAHVVGRDPSTLRRWRQRGARGEPLGRRRGPRARPADQATRSMAVAVVRELHALVGVETLRRTCPGLTRQEAARVKADTRRDMEHERRLRATRVEIAAPGVIRGFDSMVLARDAHLLVAADGAVPYRTSWRVVPRYDGDAVAGLLAEDFARNGAPLVMRLDRARQHDVEEVSRMLGEHQVIRLHGPAHRPQYYGQLERQNRDHRAWMRAETESGLEALERMMSALNDHWLRRTLGWRTPGEVWRSRPDLRLDRQAMRCEVEQTSRRLVGQNGLTPDLGWRLAVERALTNRGLLRVVVGGWC